MTDRSSCWCGNSDLVPFSPGYFRCRQCETLVWGRMPGPEITHVVDQAAEFYGREYWFDHQERDLGFPNILDRARTDLSERSLYWLRTLLKYKLPPGRVLELGSGPGAFVAMLHWAGFDATGLELSPWVVRFIRETFHVPVLHGPVEEQQIEPASLDVIALMDVLEHFRDPVGTMRHCLGLLKPDGILLIQTPCYPEGRAYEDLVTDHDRFVENLKPTDHLYLFSRRSVRDLFQRLGVEHVVFEVPMFVEYDMFMVVSRTARTTFGPTEIGAALSTRPAGRMVQALLDLDVEHGELKRRHAEAEADRAARLAQVEEMTRLLRESETDRAARLAQTEEATRLLQESEADRAARLAQVEEMTRLLQESEADRAARLAQVEEMTRLLQESEADRAARLDQIHELSRLLEEANSDRTTSRDEVRNLTAQLEEGRATLAARLAQIDNLSRLLEDSEGDRTARLEQIHELSRLLRELDQDREARQKVIHDLETKIAAFERSWVWRLRRAVPPALTGRNPEE